MNFPLVPSQFGGLLFPDCGGGVSRVGDFGLGHGLAVGLAVGFGLGTNLGEKGENSKN